MVVRSVAVWLNVFIPWDVGGMTVTIPDGPHAGKTALDGPALLLTDQRAFSNDPRASSRMHSCITIDLAGSQPDVTVNHRCDWAVTCDRVRGDIICRARSDTRRMKASVVSVDPVVVRLECAASHPCPGAVSPLNDTQYRGTIGYRLDIRELTVDMMVGMFPAVEGYGAVNDGPPVILFRQAPTPGDVTLPAAGAAHRRMRAIIDDCGSLTD